MASFVEEKTGHWSRNDLVKAEKFSSPPHRQNVVAILADDGMLPGWCSHISPSGKPSSVSLVHRAWPLLVFWSG